MLKVYAYKNCSTCKKAQKFLEEKGIEHKVLPIRETPPSKAELKKMLKAYEGDIKKLFNTSGQDYRAMGIKDKIADMSADEAIELLASNGNLIKRPFALSSDFAIVGFKEDAWADAK